MEERLQKILSASGLCSRRKAEEYIADGRVTINGQIATMGQRADAQHDVVALDGKTVTGRDEIRTYLMLNKPRGFVSTLSDESGRKTVAQLVADCGGRVWPVGRLDLDSEGLLLMTDDGEVTNRLIHPRHQVEKEYLVWVGGDVTAALPILEGPLELDGEALAPAQIRVLGAGLLSVVICQGKNRQVRRMCQLAGLKVFRLKRVREGELLLGELTPGKWRVLTPEEVTYLQSL